MSEMYIVYDSRLSNFSVKECLDDYHLYGIETPFAGDGSGVFRV